MKVLFVQKYVLYAKTREKLCPKGGLLPCLFEGFMQCKIGVRGHTKEPLSLKRTTFNNQLQKNKNRTIGTKKFIKICEYKNSKDLSLYKEFSLTPSQ